MTCLEVAANMRTRAKGQESIFIALFGAWDTETCSHDLSEYSA